MARNEPSEHISPDELALALEKAYRRGFQQALTLLATFYPDGISGRELAEWANEHLIWRRSLPESHVGDSAMPQYYEVSPLERAIRGGY